MDEQQQSQAQPTDPVTPAAQPTTPVIPQEPATPGMPVQPEVGSGNAEESARKDFMDAYNTLCKEKGFELAFEVKPQFDGKLYDLTKVSIVYSVAKLK